MFRFVLIGLIVLIAFPGGLAANDKILSVLNWSEYLDDDLVAEFERRYEVDVQFTYFESSDDRDRIMAENDGAGFDLVLAEDASIRALSLLGWLQPFDEREVPNLRHLDPRWLARDEQGESSQCPISGALWVSPIAGICSSSRSPPGASFSNRRRTCAAISP